ncbi:helix-turn-helix domain-containing protein [Streptococcus sp. A11]|nr:helix-turn-helix domain-containing protein [Streptococcus suis]WNF83432.1 helix-turn-helix domain-containing protein [Streptococcus suis]
MSIKKLNQQTYLQTNYSTAFKRHYHQSPSKWRQENR